MFFFFFFEAFWEVFPTQNRLDIWHSDTYLYDQLNITYYALKMQIKSKRFFFAKINVYLFY